MKIKKFALWMNLLLCSVALGQVVGSVSATGWMTDTICGAKGANALHIDCAKRKVASARAKYAKRPALIASSDQTPHGGHPTGTTDGGA